jgi:hypothetical protein
VSLLGGGFGERRPRVQSLAHPFDESGAPFGSAHGEAQDVAVLTAAGCV